MRPRVLILTEYYRPFHAAGPVRTLSNLVESLGDEIDFRVVTGDRQRGDLGPRADVKPGRWTPRGSASCLHLERGPRRLLQLYRVLRATPHEILYLNSLFSRRYSIEPLLLRRIGLLPHKPVVLAPRGELAPAALALKAAKKRAFLAAARRIGLFDGVRWQATSAGEAREIRRIFGVSETVRVVPNIAMGSGGAPERRPPKRRGVVRVAFLSRVAPMKNLLGALDILAGVRANVSLDIHGPIEDVGYWRRCEQRIAGLPPNVVVHVAGPVPFGAATTILASYDVLLLPTLGENYGHVIVEALAAGCPVLISDTTPWRGLERRRVGWDLPLADTERWRAAVESCAAMDDREHAEWSQAAARYATEIASDGAAVDAARELFGAPEPRGDERVAARVVNQG